MPTFAVAVAMVGGDLGLVAADDRWTMALGLVGVAIGVAIVLPGAVG